MGCEHLAAAAAQVQLAPAARSTAVHGRMVWGGSSPMHVSQPALGMGGRLVRSSWLPMSAKPPRLLWIDLPGQSCKSRSTEIRNSGHDRPNLAAQIHLADQDGQ